MVQESPPPHSRSVEHSRTSSQVPSTQLRSSPQSTLETQATQLPAPLQKGTLGSKAQSPWFEQAPTGIQPDPSQRLPTGQSVTPRQAMGLQLPPSQVDPTWQWASPEHSTQLPEERSHAGVPGLPAQSRSSSQTKGLSQLPAVQARPSSQCSSPRQPTQLPSGEQWGESGMPVQSAALSQEVSKQLPPLHSHPSEQFTDERHSTQKRLSPSVTQWGLEGSASTQSSSPSQVTGGLMQLPDSQTEPSAQSPSPRQPTQASPASLQKGVSPPQSPSPEHTVPTQPPSIHCLPSGQCMVLRHCTHWLIFRSQSFPAG